jgi:molecular chaperone DnaK (HSP70)
MSVNLISISGTLLNEQNGMISFNRTYRSNQGADLIVKALSKTLTAEVNRKFRCDVTESKQSIKKIENEARRAIEVLSNKDSVAIQIESCFEGMDFQGSTNRMRLEGTAPYKKIVEEIFEEFKDILPSQVIIAGGGAKSPKIQVGHLVL